MATLRQHNLLHANAARKRRWLFPAGNWRQRVLILVTATYLVLLFVAVIEVGKFIVGRLM